MGLAFAETLARPSFAVGGAVGRAAALPFAILSANGRVTGPEVAEIAGISLTAAYKALGGLEAAGLASKRVVSGGQGGGRGWVREYRLSPRAFRILRELDTLGRPPGGPNQGAAWREYEARRDQLLAQLANRNGG